MKTIRAAKDTKTEIIWDLLHFGWPDHTDVFAGDFPAKFGKFAAAFTRVLTEEGIERPFLAPVNEISFMAWAGGDIGILNPFGQGRGPELKLQLVRATIEAIESIWAVTKNVRIVSPEPVIHIAADLSRPGEREVAEGYRRSMFEAWDMISGTLSPALGGRPEYLDIVGVNYYDRNQWIHNGAVLRPGDTQYRPFRDLLKEVYERYRRPMFVAETGTENDERPAWFNYVAEEVLAAIHAGVDMHGLCLYPVANHPGWDDNRHCYNGLLDYPNDAGEREVYYPLAEAVLEASGQFQAEFQQ